MFQNNAWLKVWKIEAKEHYTQIQGSTSTKKNGNYVTDFSGFARLIGKAHEKAADIQEKDSIKITNCGVSTNFANGKNYTNFCIFDFETKDSEENSSAADIDDDSLPFS